MNKKNSFAGIFLGTALIAVSASVFATNDDASGAGLRALTGNSTDQPTGHPKSAHKSVATRGSLEQCIRENTKDAEAFCQTDSNHCAAEKSGVRKECEAELRGERHSG